MDEIYKLIKFHTLGCYIHNSYFLLYIYCLVYRQSKFSIESLLIYFASYYQKCIIKKKSYGYD